jgi:uncharacterized cupredoxin-like copper-binding protein
MEVANRGEDPHDLHVAREDGSGAAVAFQIARPGSQTARTVQLTRGAWRLWCSLPGHEAAGMHATLQVGAAATR